ncbi:MAG: cytidine 5'-phosphate N-acetylneuraminic acid synthetase [Candidatus Riflebacteria bacterium]|nr:cytidine 5'-phosphate N-acetylneuraminic acid synthetase [Candidatus Riflebacteria bacterium]
MLQFAIIIPAVKKNVAFADDLIKKLNGITLIQHAINKSKHLTNIQNIFVVTDSQGISLICERNEVKYFYQQDLRLSEPDIIESLKTFLLSLKSSYNNFLIVFPYCPTLSHTTIQNAFIQFSQSDYDILLSVKEEKKRVYREIQADVIELMSSDVQESFLTEIKGFLIFRSTLVEGEKRQLKIGKYLLDNETVEIKNYQDWWICEKLLKKKRIVFRVIGYPEVGMGHIFRSLSLAHEITDHEVLFVCDEKSALAVETIAVYDYIIKEFPSCTIEQEIINLKPDLVVNDILNTKKEYILRLKQKGIKTLNFEDLGPGASFTDLTINDLYEKNTAVSKNILWGPKFFFIREEFCNARKGRFRKEPRSVLLTFGGTDPSNIAFKVLNSLLSIFQSSKIEVYIILGEGYRFKNDLLEWIKKQGSPKINVSFAVDAISGYMEKVDFAICANGRTVFELAHMRIPALVFSQNERELEHSFASPKNGFIHLGFCNESSILQLQHFCQRLISEPDFRKELKDRMKRHNFINRRKRIVSLINQLLESSK